MFYLRTIEGLLDAALRPKPVACITRTEAICDTREGNLSCEAASEMSKRDRAKCSGAPKSKATKPSITCESFGLAQRYLDLASVKIITSDY